MKKSLILILCILTAALAVSIPKTFKVSAEEETATDKEIVYISNAGELLEYTSLEYASDEFENYILVLTNDIDLDDDDSWHKYVPDWQTNGWYARNTHASIEGNGYTIKNLWSNRSTLALFDSIADNFVKNLNINLKHVPVPNPISTDSSLYREMKSGLSTTITRSVISNVHVKGNLIYAGGIGGISAWATFSTIKNCSYQGDIVASGGGGLVGSLGETTLTDCFFKGSIYAAGGGGLAWSLFGGGDNVITNNCFLIEDITYISRGAQQLGTFAGKIDIEFYSEMTIQNNYVLKTGDFKHAVMNTGGLGTPSDIPGVTTLANISDFAVKANLTGYDDGDDDGLNFETIWNMDEELQHPIHKPYSLGLINLSSDGFSTSFSLTSEDRLYNGDEQIEFEVDLINAEHQIIVFDINGEDKLSTLQTGKIILPAGKNYAIVIKAGNKYEFTIAKQEGAEISFTQGTTVAENSDSYTVKFKMGDSITFNLTAKEGYTITEPTLSGLTLNKNADGSYTITAPKTKNFNENQSYALTYTANLDNTKGGGDNDNNNLPIIIGSTAGGAVLLGLAITIIIVKKKKKSQ